MSVISMKQLLEAGVHFGHQTRRWNPKMAPYIYTERNGIYIIDLQKSVGKVDEAYNAMFRDTAANGGTHPFCWYEEAGAGCHRRQRQSAAACTMSTQRWLGGMLTNYQDNPEENRPSCKAMRRRCRRTEPSTYCRRRKSLQLEEEN